MTIYYRAEFNWPELEVWLTDLHQGVGDTHVLDQASELVTA